METKWQEQTGESAQESGSNSVKCEPEENEAEHNLNSFASDSESEFDEINAQIKVELCTGSDSRGGALTNNIQPELVEFREIGSHQNPNPDLRQTFMLEKIPKMEKEISGDTNQEYDLYNIERNSDSYANSDPERDPFADVDCDPSFSQSPLTISDNNSNNSSHVKVVKNAVDVNDSSNPLSSAKKSILPTATTSKSKHNVVPNTLLGGTNWQCQLCHETRTSNKKLKIHVEICSLSHKDRHRFCILCNRVFSSPHWYRYHASKIHKIQVPMFVCESFKCVLCPSTFASQESLSSHSASHHSNTSLPIEDVPSSIVNSRPLICPGCPSTFSTLANLTHHIMTSKSHENGRLLNCPMPNCTKEYRSNRFLQDHLRQTHSEFLPATLSSQEFKCPMPNCTKEYRSNRFLQDHLRQTHSEFLPAILSSQEFKCPKPNCGKAFQHNSNLNMHMDISHAKEDSIPLVCPEPNCGKIFQHEGFLKYHLNVHTNERPFKSIEPEPNAAVQPARTS